MEVWFVGINPTLRNLDPSIPFAGTRTGIKLNGWIKKLGIEGKVNSINLFEEIGTPTYMKLTENRKKLFVEALSGNKVIALGELVSKNLRQLMIPHFKLPHPSGRNRLLNDPQFERRMLERCKEWLNAKKDL